MIVAMTGAGGFIGRAVLRANSGFSFRLHTGPGDHPIPEPPGQCVVASGRDIGDDGALGELGDGADVLIHLAGPPSVADSFFNPVEVLRSHVLGTARLLEHCRRHRIERLVYVSSAEVYGRPARLPTREDALPAPRSPYAAAKAGAEAVIGAAARAGGPTAVVLRPFSVYGPGLRRSSVVGRICEQILEQRPRIELFDLAPVRDYVFASDLAAAVLRACEANLEEPVLTLNVASGRGVSVRELAEQALAVAGHVAAVVELPRGDRPRQAVIRELVGDPSLAHDALGWRAKTPLGDGLRETMDWLHGEPVHLE